MTTTLYFHAALSTVSGTLPSTAVFSAATIGTNMDAYTVNRHMNITIGTSQTSISKSVTGSTDPFNVYITRFISDPLTAQTISSNTWTYYDATKSSTASSDWPGEAGGNGSRYAAIYVWRPSTGAVVGTIINGLSATVSAVDVNTTEKSSKLTYTGASVVCLSGDVLAIEIMGADYEPSAITDYWYYDGTVLTTTDNTATSNMASQLTTPQTLSFSIPSIVCTVTKKTVTNKFIKNY